MLHNGKMIRMQILWKLCWKLSFASKEVITNFNGSCSNPRILNNGKEKTLSANDDLQHGSLCQWLSFHHCFQINKSSKDFYGLGPLLQHIFLKFGLTVKEKMNVDLKKKLAKMQQRTSATQFGSLQWMVNLRLCNDFFGEFGFCNNQPFFGLSRTLSPCWSCGKGSSREHCWPLSKNQSPTAFDWAFQLHFNVSN